ncbi:MarR family transcriptional regulator [Ralstonia solanacearum]|uniref:MarR family transcriptional regulator n=3 Tax=Ralstonia TaxID=48736 RepID=A0AAD0SAJ3_RALSL|nr:MarR family transcriptional regulator [Ralstonia solanacearum]AXW54314.1 MarR family transcriptional regulator [Ralstonia solanacearum]QOK86315.1 winged helix-turn-helix transcriptional regulator [Ralstonia pseudosolanacearum]
MSEMKRTPAGMALTDLFLDLFRLNSRVIASGDRLVAPLGLTSARWQVLGTILATDRPQPVAWLARDMGTNRQSVQRIVNDLVEEGLVEFQPNPHHRRAQLVMVTAKGKQAAEAAMRLQAPWVNDLSDGLRVEDIQTMRKVVSALRTKLESNEDAEE